MRIIQGLGIFLLCVGISSVQVQNNNTQYAYQIGVLKYRGGGDYYANPTSLPNLVQYANKNKNTRINPETPYVDVGSPDLFNYPFVHMTGHGNVVFSPSDIQNLRNYLLGGGFLHIDDNYGLDQFIRPEITKIFPDNKLVELPYNHEIFEYPYSFPKFTSTTTNHHRHLPSLKMAECVCFILLKPIWVMVGKTKLCTTIRQKIAKKP
jgi:hypothetical protein